MQDPEELARKKQLFTFLPVIVLPCLVLLFWGLGGGGSQAAAGAASLATENKVNTDFPEPILSKEDSKFDAYELTEAEASRRRRSLERDPYADQLLEPDTVAAPGAEWERRYAERTEALESKLQLFDRRVEAEGRGGTPTPSPPAAAAGGDGGRKLSSTHPPSSYAPRGLSPLAEEEAAKVAQLEATMARLNGYGGSAASGALPAPPPGLLDPESGGLSAEDSLASVQLDRLDKIMERATLLQYPELAEEQLRERSAENGEYVYVIGDKSATEREVRYFGTAMEAADSLPGVRGGFYTDGVADNFEQVTVAAQVHGDVTVMDGSTVKLRLLDEVYLAGQRIPAHSFVYASTSMNGDRLRMLVKSINFRGNIYQVNLEGYDLDGQIGIGVPGAIERDIAKREAAQAARGIGGARTGGGNLATQLAAEGTETIRQIAARKMAAIKVDLKAGHRIILHND